MLIPTGTDAPLYHPLWGTLGLLIANVLAFLFIDIDRHSWLILQHGTINPLQWVTSVFMHAGFFHLLGNMLFLVIFAGIVEGKVGWRWLLIIYGGIAIISCAFEQIIMLGSNAASLGASGVIYGLLVICLFWAPRNSIRGIVIIIVYPLVISWPLWVVGLLFIGLDLLEWILVGFAFGTPMLHLIGAAAGIWPGWYFLKQRMVDCEGWDAITIYDRWRAGKSMSAIALNQAHREALDGGAIAASSNPETQPVPATQQQIGTVQIEKNWMDDIGKQ